MAYTEFYCDSSAGNNMNGGSPIGGVYPLTYTNGGWVSGTGVFTVASGNPQTDGVTVGDFAAVFVDGATTPAFVGRVTARNTTTITVSTSIKIGTVPTTGASGQTCKVGGAWLGPNGAVGWPVGNVVHTLVNSAADAPRINMKAGTYSITAGLTQSGSVTYEGYTTTPGDGGRATIDGSTNAIVLWTNSGSTSVIRNMIFSNNGTTGTNTGVLMSGGDSKAIGCIAHDIRGHGFSTNTAGIVFYECEAYACNGSNTANLGGFHSGSGAICVRCISHDNSGSNSAGFQYTGSAGFGGLVCVDCVSESNGGDGFRASGSGSPILLNCDSYNNGGSGIDVSTSQLSTAYVENTNIVKNTGTAIKTHASASRPTLLFNSGYGSGTQANGSTSSGLNINFDGTVTYASNLTPWMAPTTGDFRINLSTAIGTGRGSYTETQASYTGTAANPVIGACQVAGYPAVADVESGVTYANAAYTGTLSAGGVVMSRVFTGF